MGQLILLRVMVVFVEDVDSQVIAGGAVSNGVGVKSPIFLSML